MYYPALRSSFTDKHNFKYRYNLTDLEHVARRECTSIVIKYTYLEVLNICTELSGSGEHHYIKTGRGVAVCSFLNMDLEFSKWSCLKIIAFR